MSKDDAVKDEVVADTTVAESAPAEPTTDDGSNEQVEDVTDLSLEEAEKQAQQSKEETEDSGELTPPESDETKPDKPRGEDGKFVKSLPEEVPPEAKTEKAVNRWQEMANKNKELEAEIAKLKSQESQFATEQELLNEINPETGDYYTPQEVERIAFAKSREEQAKDVSQKRYELEVRSNQATLVSEASRALEDFPMFDEQSPQFNANLAAQADGLLKQALIIDNGVIVGSTHSPYQIYKTIADATQANAAQVRAEAQKSVERMTAASDSAPSASQATKTKPDPIMAGFDEEVSSWKK